MGVLPAMPISSEQLLRRNHIRVTYSRLSVLDLFREHALLAPDQAYRLLIRQHPKINLSTVYRVLVDMDKAGILERVCLGNRPTVYARAADLPALYLRCGCCGDVTVLTDARLYQQVEGMAASASFQVRQANLTLHGLCHACRTKRQDARGSRFFPTHALCKQA